MFIDCWHASCNQPAWPSQQRSNLATQGSEARTPARPLFFCVFFEFIQHYFYIFLFKFPLLFFLIFCLIYTYYIVFLIFCFVDFLLLIVCTYLNQKIYIGYIYIYTLFSVFLRNTDCVSVTYPMRVFVQCGRPETSNKCAHYIFCMYQHLGRTLQWFKSYSNFGWVHMFFSLYMIEIEFSCFIFVSIRIRLYVLYFLFSYLREWNEFPLKC